MVDIGERAHRTLPLGGACRYAMTALALTWVACDRDVEQPPGGRSGSHASPSALPSGTAAAAGAPTATASAPAPVGAASATPAAAPSCPDGMRLIPGGRLWLGSDVGQGPPDEHPKFEAHIGAFCLDRTEVTVAKYQQCVEAGGCDPARTGPVTCTATGGNRPNHPINCVSWHQSVAYCAHRLARLPTEAEWEFAARGGDDRQFAWGDDPPDGRTCWKKPGACEVGSYPEEAYGLVDMTGNLWEWVADAYGPYPWPPEGGAHRVYRGGSWSRRFDKWMRVRLRNRWAPEERGSHLGFRCAYTPEATPCPGGRTEDGARCRLAVLGAECPPGETWNGARCARPGEPRCTPGSKEVPEHGCVGEALTKAPRRSAGSGDESAAATPVTRARSPEFDADCATYQPSRPVAYRFEGGTHAARTAAGAAAGCKNRDVGVGWNSACCPS